MRTRSTTKALVAVLMMAGAPGVPAQTAPATTPASPAPAATAQPQPAQPAEQAYSYEAAGRRDPFVSLLSRGAEPSVGGKKATGLSGLVTNELMVRGVLQSRGAYIALVSGPDGKTYSARANDRLLDGVIRSVSPQGLVIMQDVNDPLSLVKQREVRKGLRTGEDAK